jgi:UDP-xylose/UDP-N-acetylglucosamine transporter B4
MFIFNHNFSGLPVSMLFGYIFSRRQYTPMQIVSPPYVTHVPSYSISSVQFSVVIVTAGVIMVTLSRTNPGTNSQTLKSLGKEDLRKYSLGIAMSTVSLFCTGLLGLLQERTYRKYGPCWREGVFYTVGAHSLPASRPLT